MRNIESKHEKRNHSVDLPYFLNFNFENSKDMQHEFLKKLLGEVAASSSGIWQPVVLTILGVGDHVDLMLWGQVLQAAYAIKSPHTFVEEFASIIFKQLF